MRMRPDIGRRVRPVLSEKDRARRVSTEALWYALLTLAGVAVIVVGVISAASVSPRFCAVCHRSATDGLDASAHTGTNCDTCHTRSGALGLVEQRFRVVSMVVGAPFTALGGGSAGIPGAENTRCVECHRNMLDETFTVRGVTMNHRAPEEEGWLCVQCHLGIAHGGDRYAGSSYTMDMCLSCHGANPQNTETCGLCHPPGESPDVAHVTPWSITHGPNWRTAHGMGNLSTCSTCHSGGYCVACHNVELPHPGNYLARHGIDVLARPTGDADCIVCHKGSACDNCHGIEMPHPGGFVREHVDLTGELGEDLCLRCHNQHACDACHQRHVHPGVPTDLLRQLQERPVIR